tara:strand:+ start:176 stop:436 length:261 start_codon:yes stop_codon:yes gene_type:complete
MKPIIFEMTQRAENGGSPLSNDTAANLDIDHGTPLIVMPKRHYIALLKAASRAIFSGDQEFMDRLDDHIDDHDSFVQRVQPDEIEL